MREITGQSEQEVGVDLADWSCTITTQFIILTSGLSEMHVILNEGVERQWCVSLQYSSCPAEGRMNHSYYRMRRIADERPKPPRRFPAHMPPVKTIIIQGPFSPYTHTHTSGV